MASRQDPDDDDDFSELYKEYTGPLGSKVADSLGREKTSKRSHAGSDEEEESKDPNAVPTDFTSREAKVWEAKSKATERNWKKRKEEEMICKLCGESGHFTQGCPTTLGANRKSQDFFERVAARDKHIKELFTGKVIDRIERDIGCKIKMEEKFIIVSGKDRLILKKGVDAVHKVIKEEGDQRGSSGSHLDRSRSPKRSPTGARFRHRESQRPYPGPPTLPYQQRFGRQERDVEDQIREDMQKFSRSSPQAFGNSGGRGRSSHSRSPAQAPFTGNPYIPYDGHNQSIGVYRNEGWDAHRRESDMQSCRQCDHNGFPQTLEDLELEFKREAMELAQVRDREEDEENYKHRQALREMREDYVKKFAALRSTHAKHLEELLKLESQNQQQTLQQTSASDFAVYRQQSFSDYNASAANPGSLANNPPLEPRYRSEYDGSAINPRYTSTNPPLEPRNRYSNPLDNYPARSHDFRSQKHGHYGKAYNRC